MDELLLDLRGVACPINFVRTKLKLDQLSPGSLLTVLLDDGEPITSVSQSIQEEGHTIQSQNQDSDSSWVVVIVRK